MSKFFDAVRRATEQAGPNAGPVIPDLTPIFGESDEPAYAAAESLTRWAEQQRLSRNVLAEERAIRRASASPGAATVLVPLVQGGHRAAGQYAKICDGILQHPERPRLLSVSGSCSGDGKTVTAINLAASLSQKEKSAVLLVDADFRRSKLAERLGIDAAPGLADVLRGVCTARDAIMQLEPWPGLYVLPGGSDLTSAIDLLDSPRWQLASKTFASLFDFTVIDAPAVAQTADYELIQSAVDAVILVARIDHTRRALLREAVEAVPKHKLLGLVMNCTG